MDPRALRAADDVEFTEMRAAKRLA